MLKKIGTYARQDLENMLRSKSKFENLGKSKRRLA